VAKRVPLGGDRGLKTFGAMLGKLRNEALRPRASYEQVALRLRKEGLPPISSSALQRYEKQERVPDVLALWSLSRLYSLDELALVRAFLASVKNQDITEPALREIALSRPQDDLEGSTLPAKIWRLEQQTEDLNRRLAAVRDAATNLIAAIDPGLSITQIQEHTISGIERIDTDGGADANSPNQPRDLKRERKVAKRLRHATQEAREESARAVRSAPKGRAVDRKGS